VALIDGGRDIYFNRVRNYLETRVVGRDGRICWVILTHPHADHHGSLPRILDHFNIGTVLRPIVASASTHDADNDTRRMDNTTFDHGYAEFVYAAYRNAETVEIIRAGIYIYGDDWRLFFHTPTPDNVDAAFGLRSVNNLSPIKTLEFGNQIFVLTGDAESLAETDFRTSVTARTLFNDFGGVVHLGVSHHGSATSSTVPFLGMIRPTTAVISAGTRYGFPADEVMGRLRNAGIREENIFITREAGHIVIRTDGNDYRIFLGFDNPPDLWWLVAVLVIVIIFLCFLKLNIREKYNHESHESDIVVVENETEENN